MHDQCAGLVQEVHSYLIRSKCLNAPFFFGCICGIFEKLHVDPGIRIEKVCLGRCRLQIEGFLKKAGRPCLIGKLFVFGGFVYLRRHRRDPHSGLGTSGNQRIAHIVPNAHVNHVSAIEFSPDFADRHQIAKRLAGMVPVAAPVNHRHLGPVGKFLQVAMIQHPGHNDVGVPGKHLGLVSKVRELEIGGAPVQIHGIPAQLVHARLKRTPGTRRRFLKQHRQRPSLQSARKSFRVCLHQQTRFYRFQDIRFRPCLERNQIHGRTTLPLTRSRDRLPIAARFSSIRSPGIIAVASLIRPATTVSPRLFASQSCSPTPGCARHRQTPRRRGSHPLRRGNAG